MFGKEKTLLLIESLTLFGKEINLLPLQELETRLHDRPVRSLIAIPTACFRLFSRIYVNYGFNIIHTRYEFSPAR